MQINHTKPQWLALFVCLLLLPMRSAAHFNELEPSDFPVLDVEWSPDGNAYAIIDDRGQVIVLDTTDGTKLFQLDGTDEILFMAAVSWDLDGTLLAAGVGNQVYIWETSFWKLKAQFTAGNRDGQAYSEYLGNLPEGITTLSWRGDSRFLAAASVSSITTVWDNQKYQIIYHATDYSSGFPGRLWLDNQILTDGRTDLNPFSGERIRDAPYLSYPIGDVNAIAINEPHQLFARVDESGYLHINDLCAATASSVKVTESDPSQVRPRAVEDVSWNKNGKLVVVVTRDGEVRVVNLESAQIETVAKIAGRLNAVDWNPQTNEVIYAGVSEDGTPILSIIDVAGIAGVPAVLSDRGAGD